MMIRSSYLDLGPKGSAYVRLVFNPLPGHMSFNQSGMVQEAYLFLNDESGQNEECFLFRITITT
jgi:hypothetical protein